MIDALEAASTILSRGVKNDVGGQNTTLYSTNLYCRSAYSFAFVYYVHSHFVFVQHFYRRQRSVCCRIASVDGSQRSSLSPHTVYQPAALARRDLSSWLDRNKHTRAPATGATRDAYTESAFSQNDL